MNIKGARTGEPSPSSSPPSTRRVSRPRRASATVRLSLDVSSEVDGRLGELASSLGASKTEVIRRALALFELSVEAARSGKKVGFASNADDLDTVVAVLF